MCPLGSLRWFIVLGPPTRGPEFTDAMKSHRCNLSNGGSRDWGWFLKKSAGTWTSGLQTITITMTYSCFNFQPSNSTNGAPSLLNKHAWPFVRAKGLDDQDGRESFWVILNTQSADQTQNQDLDNFEPSEIARLMVPRLGSRSNRFHQFSCYCEHVTTTNTVHTWNTSYAPQLPKHAFFRISDQGFDGKSFCKIKTARSISTARCNFDLCQMLP